MNSEIYVLPIIFSFLIFVISSKLKYNFALLSLIYSIVITTIPSIAVFFVAGSVPFKFSFFSTEMIIDNLSAFFILVTNFTMLTGMLYSNGYLKPYLNKKSSFEFSLHYFSFVWLHLSMLGVLLFRDGLAFLIAWELMAVSSFMLVLFEGEKRKTLKTAVNYLIQMHIGFIFILIAFLICQSQTGLMSFDALKLYFANNLNFGLFILFFVGFGIKAGFIPLHTWLPDAHPAAPSNVSGVMSGVMIKMGIYGIVRVLTFVQSDLYYIGLFILVISAISGILGVMKAIIQHDLKTLLAFHSIENIGIIGMGIGLGLMGLGLNNPMLAMFGFVGGLMHVLNHSLFKSLLFFSAGSVYKNYHTKNIESLGGVIHKMPKTASLFLVGSIAICGLPPLNGFISEILIYCGLFKGLSHSFFYNSIAMMLGIISLVLIGGLAVFCFTKAFSVVFLGVEREKHSSEIAEVENGMLFPQLLIAILIFVIGLFPWFFIKPLTIIVSSQFHINIDNNIILITNSLGKISFIGLILIALIVGLYFLRKNILNKRVVVYGPTWGCGYTAGSEKQQYTGTSYANNFREIAKPFFLIHKDYKKIHEDDIFPTERNFATHPDDIFKQAINKIIDFCMMILKKLARLQTGSVQHYILYAFLFILVILVLLFMKII